MPDQFFWHELMTSDPKAAQKFYSDVVGWTTQDTGVAGQQYTLFNVKGQGIAGMLTITPDMAQHGARPGWLGYVSVDDVDQTLSRIKKEGGNVHIAPQEVPGIIRFAMVADPQGAPFYIAKGLVPNPPPPLAIGTPGTVGWNELMTSDWQTAFTFYSKMFGWTKAEAHDMGPMGIYQLFAAGGPPIGGMMTKPPQIPVAYWGFYFNVDAIDAGTDRITKSGGRILNGPIQVPGGQWVVQAMDPQGAAFNLVAPQR
jgi:predicted enzyme related to lactoylglutathione lyase